MKLLSNIFVAISVLFLPLLPNIFAQNIEFYNQVIHYGTDSDIASAFTDVTESLGDDINGKILLLFQEEHSIEVFSALVGYIAASGLTKAEETLINELHNGPADEDYRERVIYALGKVGKKASLEVLKSYYFNYKSTIKIKRRRS